MAQTVSRVELQDGDMTEAEARFISMENLFKSMKRDFEEFGRKLPATVDVSKDQDAAAERQTEDAMSWHSFPCSAEEEDLAESDDCLTFAVSPIRRSESTNSGHPLAIIIEESRYTTRLSNSIDSVPLNKISIDNEFRANMKFVTRKTTCSRGQRKRRGEKNAFPLLSKDMNGNTVDSSARLSFVTAESEKSFVSSEDHLSFHTPSRETSDSELSYLTARGDDVDSCSDDDLVKECLLTFEQSLAALDFDSNDTTLVIEKSES
ncbi:hypothetical protein Ciccas_000949 [Cichlidogyrus casuarinus]|uniref:Uncharacterized protein n=1 Tax=Cichlidogyrus casuarinus TaxID=1844966 RepID=A0ABD2QLJ6_9PLAT